MSTLRKHSILALAYFLFIALLGVFLRLFPLIDTAANYRYIVHTHSHVALLGWVYTALMVLLYKLYLTKADVRKRYHVLFWSAQFTIIGMLLTFPITGYALFSIIFSTLFIITTYLFTWFFIKHTSTEQKKTNSYKCIRIALWYMIISSIGPWALGYIMNTAESGSSLYRNAIYFYLHFQYNGWFILALFGILFFLLEQHGIIISKKGFNRFYWFMNIGVVATFGISLLWMKPHMGFYIISGVGALLQLFAFGILLKELFHPYKNLKIKKSKSFILLRIVVALFILKLLFQLIGTIPSFAAIIASNIDVVIGYIHWIFLGIVSTALLAFLHHFKLILINKRVIVLYFAGFFLTEGVIFYKGIVVWQNLPLIANYSWYLVIASSIFLIAIASAVSIQFKKSKR